MCTHTIKGIEYKVKFLKSCIWYPHGWEGREHLKPRTKRRRIFSPLSSLLKPSLLSSWGQFALGWARLLRRMNADFWPSSPSLLLHWIRTGCVLPPKQTQSPDGNLIFVPSCNISSTGLDLSFSIVHSPVDLSVLSFSVTLTFLQQSIFF